MNNEMLQKATEIKKEHQFTKKWKRVVAVVCAMTVLATSYSLILPAITEHTEAYCGHEEHVHSEEAGCYEIKTILNCTHEETPHLHSDACYEEHQVYICGMEEGGGHEHSGACYAEKQNLICTLEECPAHQHGEGCYDEAGNLICELEETVGHTHSVENGCYETVKELVCGLEESEGHVHSEACVKTERTLICGLEEGQIEQHEHTEECYHTELVFICEKEEHQHKLACFSNPNADVESSSVWERTFQNVELTGVWADDVLAIADTQLGYTESTRNYIVEDDGETIKGYTRYGDWYGDSHGDWCAMFVSFCLNYAGVDRELMPLESGCQRWVEKLTELGIYHTAGIYEPKPGDLIFFNWDEQSDADHVGLVYDLTKDENDVITHVKTIEGNNGNRVAYHTYEITDNGIMGYGELPENPNPAVNIEPTDQLLECTCGVSEGEPHEESCPLYEAPEESELECTCGAAEGESHAEDCPLYVAPEETEPECTCGAAEDEPHAEDCPLYVAPEETEPECTCGAADGEPHAEDCPLYVAPEETEIECTCGAADGEPHAENCPLYEAPEEIVLECTCGAAEGEAHEKGCPLFEDTEEKAYIILNNGDIQFTAETNSGTGIILTGNEASFEGILDGLALCVEEIEDDFMTELVEDGLTESSDTYRKTQLFDIKLIKDGEEVEPTGEVSVTFTGIDSPYADAQVFHIDEDANTTENMQAVTDEDGDIVITTDGLSPYGVTWTVDFSFGEYSFSINGLTNVYLSKLFEELKIDITGKSIQDVTFSDPALIFIEKEEDDYLLKTLKAFDTQETLTVDFTDGDRLVIKVTDACGDPAYHVDTIGSDGGIKMGLYDYTHDIRNYGVVEFTGWYEGIEYPYRSGKYGGPDLRVQNVLSPDGYPVHELGSSLGYLFGGGGTDAVISYNPSNTFLQYDPSTCRYSYSSELNACDYIYDTNQFDVRSYTERSESRSQQPSYIFPNNYNEFYPFNYWDHETYAYDPTTGLQYMFGDVQTNFWFGWSLEVDFYVPLSGNLNGIDLNYYFSGDDWVWVYVDGTLIQSYYIESGSINFTTGEISQKTDLLYGNTSSSASTLRSAYDNAGTTPNGGWASNGQSFAPGSKHTLKVFAIEEGTGVSNCNISFQLPVVTHELRVEKKVEGILTGLTKDNDYTFVLQNASGQAVSGESYAVYDKASNQVIGTSTTNSSGEFTLKSGQFASFLGLDVGGRYQVVETGAPNTEETNVILNGSTPTNGTESGLFTANAYGKDEIIFTNVLSKANLTVIKNVTSGNTAESFPFEVMLKDTNGDPVLLTPGTYSPAGSVGYTVASDGKITFNLKHQETAIIEGIPVGTLATVTETDHDGYTTLVMEGTVQLSNTDKVEDFTVDTDRTITYYNNPGTVLPNTGGIGTKLFTRVGIAIMLGGFVYGVCWRRRRERRMNN